MHIQISIFGELGQVDKSQNASRLAYKENACTGFSNYSVREFWNWSDELNREIFNFFFMCSAELISFSFLMKKKIKKQIEQNII